MLQIQDEHVTLYSRVIGQPDQGKSRDDHVTLTLHLAQEPEACGLPVGLPCFSQSPSFITSYQRLLQYIKTIARELTDPCLVYVLVHVLLHFLEEWECFVGIQHILQRQSWVDRNFIEKKASILTLHKLIQTHLVSHQKLNIIFDLFIFSAKY